jgi:hypothetical protein
MLTLLLFILALALAIYGVVLLVRGELLFGVVLLIVACLVGPGGYSIFQR